MRAIQESSQEQDAGAIINLMVPFAGGAIGWIVGLWAGFSPVIQALAVLQAFDFISGLLVAMVQKQIDSHIGARGLLKKGYTFALVMLVGYLQHSQLEMVGLNIPAAESIATAFAFMEIVSILENYQRSGGTLGPLEPFLAAVKRQQEQEHAHRNEEDA